MAEQQAASDDKLTEFHGKREQLVKSLDPAAVPFGRMPTSPTDQMMSLFETALKLRQQ